MLLEGKTWQAQDYFNEYLKLKEEIVDLSHSTNEELLREKVDRMKFVIEELKLNGVKTEELLFLAMNVFVKY